MHSGLAELERAGRHLRPEIARRFVRPPRGSGRHRLHRRRGAIQAMGPDDRRRLAFCLANKLMGQVNVVRLGASKVRAGGAITLTTGVLAQHPIPGGAMVTTVNAAVEAFVRAAAVEPLSVRVNAVSPGWVTETLQAMGRDPAPGIPASEVAQAFVRQLREGLSGSIALAARG
jgi:NAD(P)-dependent dehydrogenase (short-subunit alcohol dehydrogenase family)